MPYQKQHSARLRIVIGARHAREAVIKHLILAPIAIKTETRRLQTEYSYVLKKTLGAYIPLPY